VTPFDYDDISPVPIGDIYISLQKKGALTYRFGSAVVIAKEWAVTNRHVVEGVDGMQGYMAGGIRFPVRDVSMSERLDLAVFKIPPGIGVPAKVGAGVRSGDRIFSAGTTGGTTLLEGVVVTPTFQFHHTDIALRDAPRDGPDGLSITRGFVYEGNFINGFSGGPVVNADGELVGINQGRLLEVLSADEDQSFAPDKSYGLAYHIADVLIEVQRLLP
jgi:S1-C subfamily serine protease